MTPTEHAEAIALTEVSGHTPGPWKLGTGKTTRNEVMGARGAAIGLPIASVTEFVRTSRAESEANARLIAAAPELLEALTALESYLRDTPHHNAIEAAAARKAITKATTK